MSTGRGAAQESDGTALERLERLHYAEHAVSVLRKTTEMLGPIQGRRKAILYVGEGIDYELGDRSGDLMQSVNLFLSAVSRANAVMYTLDPGGLRAPALGVDQMSDGAFARALDDAGSRAYTTLRTWAGDSGGVSVVNTNDLDRGLARIVSDSSRYYVLGYHTTVESDGRFHRIDVRTVRPGMTVRSRKGFLAAPGLPKTAAAVQVVPRTSGPVPELADALSSPLPVAGGRLRLSAVPFRGNGPAHDAFVGLHLDGRDLVLSERAEGMYGSAHVQIVVLDDAGRVLATTRNTIEMIVPSGSVEAVRTRGLRYLDRIPLPPGRYRVRVGVAIGDGRIATVHGALEVPDFAALPMALSGLLVSAPRPGPGLATGAYHTDWLPGPATARRHFAPEDELTVFGELYHDGKGGPFVVVRRVFNDAGDTVREWEDTLSPSSAASAPVPVQTTLPLTGFAPGRYRLQVEVRDAQRPEMRVERDMTFVVQDVAER